jgi:perosamine synthetase
MNKLTCSINDSLIKAIGIINKNNMGIVFVVDELNKLCGTITDGDIRRALLNDVGLEEQVGSIIKDFVYGKHDESYQSLMKKITNKIKIIPLIDDNYQLIDYFKFEKNPYFPIAIPSLNGNEFKYLTDAFMSTWISSSGEYINRFESEFSKYCETSFGISCSNGTAAIHLALLALGIGEGDEVIIPNLTFAATINTVLHANATPVIVDIESNSWCIDPVEIESAITPKTKAIIAVHIFGQSCNMEGIMVLAEKYNLKVIEDCAEAHGAMYGGKKVGSFGDIGCFSFFGNKIITTGEGGMCVTSDQKLDERMRSLRDHGMSKTKKYWHDVIGYNYRLTNIQAAIGLAQLERIEAIHKKRKKYEDSYKKILSTDKFTFQCDLEKHARVIWMVSVLVDEGIGRDEFIKKLKTKGIDSRPFFYPLGDMDIYKAYCSKETPVTNKVSRLGVNLPTYESLKSISDIQFILTGVMNEL